MVKRLNPATVSALLRQKRLHSQRGTAVFIVVMVLTLLTAVGIFAVRATSLASVAAGYDREAAQASLVAEYATLTAAAYMANGFGNTVVANLQPLSYSNYCQSNANIANLKLPCVKMLSSQLEASTSSSTNGGEDLFETNSLNVNSKTDADFMLEITDPSTNGDLGHGDPHAPVQVTVTAIAQVRQAGVCANVGGTTWSAGQQVTRAFITAGNQ